jgi:hypothetical protein
VGTLKVNLKNRIHGWFPKGQQNPHQLNTQRRIYAALADLGVGGTVFVSLRALSYFLIGYSGPSGIHSGMTYGYTHIFEVLLFTASFSVGWLTEEKVKKKGLRVRK